MALWSLGSWTGTLLLLYFQYNFVSHKLCWKGIKVVSVSWVCRFPSFNIPQRLFPQPEDWTWTKSLQHRFDSSLSHSVLKMLMRDDHPVSWPSFGWAATVGQMASHLTLEYSGKRRRLCLNRCPQAASCSWYEMLVLLCCFCILFNCELLCK